MESKGFDLNGGVALSLPTKCRFVAESKIRSDTANRCDFTAVSVYHKKREEQIREDRAHRLFDGDLCLVQLNLSNCLTLGNFRGLVLSCIEADFCK